MTSDALNFDSLVAAIERTHSALAEQASKAVNLSLTLRNWFIGYYIAEFEQSGTDRAQYGAQLLDKVSARLAQAGMGGVAARSLRQYRQFYLAYPQIWQAPSAKFLQGVLPRNIWQTLSAKSESTAGDIRGATSPESGSLPAHQLLERLSFSHFVELLQLEDPTQRRFYEIECIRGNWSVRELKRQIASLYYQRSGLSQDKRGNGTLHHPDRQGGGLMKTQGPPQMDAAADSDAYQGLLREITAAVAPLQTLHQQAVETLAPTVREILQNRSRDARLIEHTLDHLLDHACIPQGLGGFKSLCRYYWEINPQATASYVVAYREMWDAGADDDQEAGHG